MMDEQTGRKLVRQLRLLTGVVVFFGLLTLIGVIAAGILLFKAIQYVQQADQNLSSLQQKAEQNLNFKQQLCSDQSLNSLLEKTGNTTCR